jgi:hypothetical protein
LHGPATQETSCHIVGLRTGIITNRTFARVLLYRTCTEASPRRLHTTFCRVSKSTPVGWRYRFELEDPSASPELQDINKSSPEISFSHSPPPSHSIDLCGCLESPNYSSSNLSGKVQTRGSGLWQQATEAQSYEPSLSPPPATVQYLSSFFLIHKLMQAAASLWLRSTQRKQCYNKASCHPNVMCTLPIAG